MVVFEFDTTVATLINDLGPSENCIFGMNSLGL